ncbi:reprolysin-like metallopeptidase [Lysobacter koreensis]|uniref:Reprolysin-like metallopeptidase n=1 Tax=Lysobacter koreensis TaxID=266122 RepID=A0ABW2YPF9_9GAMM
MSKYLSASLLLLLCAGCAEDWRPRSAGSRDAAGQRAEGSIAPAQPQAESRRRSFASLPDKGNLVGYPKQRVVRHDGAYTWHRADISESHALRAIADGSMRITTPSGEALDFRYERHIEHPSGDWTWVGRIERGAQSEEAIVTFGDRAAFGSIAQPGKAPLKLTIRDGVAWLVETDPAKVALIDNSATRPTEADYLVPPKLAAVGNKAYASSPSMEASIATAAATATAADTTVDVLLGYTNGFAAAQGGPSQAVTRLNYLVEVSNQAYANSQVAHRIRLVHAVQVSYPDNTSNDTALEALTGFRAPSTRTTPDPAFAALRAARDQYGADLVSLVRDFQSPENDGCGIAWLIGGGRSGIGPSDEYFGYSVVSDGSDPGADGKTYFCRDESLAHELGHNMGSQHDRTAATENGTLKYGLYDFSFGYKSGAGAGNFYTVMAYGDTGQTSYRVFSSPRTSFCGQPCGIEGQADNARSLTQAMPIVATFRSTVVPTQLPLDLFAIAKLGGSSTSEVHSLGGAGTFQSFTRHLATALHQTGSNYAWQFQLGDYNRDGFVDLYVIAKQGGSGTTEVHVLNGADGFRTYLLHAASALHPTGSDSGWVFRVGDYNRDGVLDLYAIGRNGGSGRTEVHVLDGASNFRSFLAHIATALGRTGSDASWDFALGDFNRDGFVDLFSISKLGPGSGTTELHVLNGANGFQTFMLQTPTALHQTGSNNMWIFKVADFNADGYLDLYAINKQGASSRTEVHVLDGARGYLAFSANIATALHSTGADNSWEFELGGPR